MKNKGKIIAIVGQTATGKTAFAIKLAKKIKGEIVSADSRQVYRGLALLSGQPTKKEMAGIRHHMIGTENPKKVFSVAEFQQKAYEIIDTILAQGKVPILVGGTGLYIDSIIKGTILPEVSPDIPLRKKLEKKSTAELFTLLSKLDHRRAQEIDKANPVRLIRAIEIATALGKVPEQKAYSNYDVFTIGLTLPEKQLRARIKKRILDRVEKGMLREAAVLHKKGLSYKRLEALGLECRFASLYLQKKISRTEYMQQLEIATWQYTRRQKTWFQKERATWISNENKKTALAKTCKLASDFIRKSFSVS